LGYTASTWVVPLRTTSCSIEITPNSGQDRTLFGKLLLRPAHYSIRLAFAKTYPMVYNNPPKLAFVAEKNRRMIGLIDLIDANMRHFHRRGLRHFLDFEIYSLEGKNEVVIHA